MFFQLMTLQYIAHFIGDYYLQSGIIAKNKSRSYYYTFLHSLIYVVSFYVFWLIFCQFDIFLLLYVSILAWSHYLVDIAKAYLNIHQDIVKEKRYGFFVDDRFLYVIDQLVHYCIICFVSVAMLKDYSLSPEFLLYEDFRFYEICFLLVIFYQPYYVSAKILFCKNKNITNTFSKDDCFLKLSGVVLGIVCLLCPIWLQITLLCFGLYDWFYSKKELVLYWIGVIIISIGIIVIFGRIM